MWGVGRRGQEDIEELDAALEEKTIVGSAVWAFVETTLLCLQTYQLLIGKPLVLAMLDFARSLLEPQSRQAAVTAPARFRSASVTGPSGGELMFS
jgi:hypothetical protein